MSVVDIPGMGRVHVCSMTDFNDLRLRTPNGRDYRFSFSKMFGPTMLNARGHEVEKLPGVRRERPFWDALQWWCKQGHRVTDGRCVYDVPPAVRYWSPDGQRNWFLDTPETRAKWAAFATDQQRTMLFREGVPVEESADALHPKTEEPQTD